MCKTINAKGKVQILSDGEWIDISGAVEPLRFVGEASTLAGFAFQELGDLCFTFAVQWKRKRLCRWHAVFTLFVLLVALIQRT